MCLSITLKKPENQDNLFPNLVKDIAQKINKSMYVQMLFNCSSY